VRLVEEAGVEPGAKAIIRLSPPEESCSIVRAVLRHCSRTPEGYKAGFGDVTPIRPGEAVDVAALLAGRPG